MDVHLVDIVLLCLIVWCNSTGCHCPFDLVLLDLTTVVDVFFSFFGVFEHRLDNFQMKRGCLGGIVVGRSQEQFSGKSLRGLVCRPRKGHPQARCAVGRE